MRSRSYAVTRRAFLASVTGALGLELILQNLEAAAVETPPPPRLLVMFWPVGTIRYLFVPEGPGTAGAPFVASPILKPFDDAGLHDDVTALLGLSNQFSCPGGGGSEAGVVFSMTGVDGPGTRKNGGEGDDACAGGPSFDQIFLRRVPALGEGKRRFVNAICDARVDSYETSSRCLSYAYETRDIESHTPGGIITEHTPLEPTLRPLDLYTEVFGSLAPEVESPRLVSELSRRQSVLDHTRRDLARLRQLAPSEQRGKLEQHEQLIRDLETELAASIEQGVGACAGIEPPDAALVGEEGSGFDYGNAVFAAAERDDLVHEQVGELHASVIRAAFQCDLLRVATFQWAPSTGHVAFLGAHAGYPDKSVMHHPMSHAYVASSLGNTQPSDQKQREFVEFMGNVHTWYNAKTAAILAKFKAATDVYGGNVLDHTVVPFVTDTADFSHVRSPLPALLLGGRALGMRGGQFVNLVGQVRSSNALWMTAAQAFVGSDPLSHFADDLFDKSDAQPIAGLWEPV